MAKKRSWFGWIKSLFSCSQTTKVAKEWRWDLGRLEFKQQYPILMASQSQRTLSDATEEQRNLALNVAVATAAAAEAAVAAAQAAAEVVRLTSGGGGASERVHLYRKLDPNLAAIKIQSVYRAHLARKALRALKGLVRLQAIVRGRAVRRRQTISALKNVHSNRKRRPEVPERIILAADKCVNNDGFNTTSLKPKDLEEKELEHHDQHEDMIQGEWNCSVLSKNDIETVILRRQEARMKRDRIKKYSYSHRERRNSFMLQDSLEPWEKQAIFRRRDNDLNGMVHIKSKNSKQREFGLSTELPLSMRNSFSQDRRNSFGDDGSCIMMLNSSPSFPTYMATTESAKAKTRSMSIPKQRVGFWDGCLDHENRQHKNKLSLCSSYDGESIWRN
ncbi:hypothetical protein CsatB_016216 [Cannabis sativa]|uniref:DUF4005 domain-containing protein n=1 Tax=Cannabis sativa TaxID=3483 RepID=A0A7J6GQG9_CANSA|nr:hypothetical protein G4B88_026479 [Cannabis sativa]